MSVDMVVGDGRARVAMPVAGGGVGELAGGVVMTRGGMVAILSGGDVAEGDDVGEAAILVGRDVGQLVGVRIGIGVSVGTGIAGRGCVT